MFKWFFENVVAASTIEDRRNSVRTGFGIISGRREKTRGPVFNIFLLEAIIYIFCYRKLPKVTTPRK